MREYSRSHHPATQSYPSVSSCNLPSSLALGLPAMRCLLPNIRNLRSLPPSSLPLAGPSPNFSVANALAVTILTPHPSKHATEKNQTVSECIYIRSRAAALAGTQPHIGTSH